MKRLTILALPIFLLVAGCATDRVVLDLDARPVTITFYHTSDLHDHSAGLSRIAKFVNDKKAEGGNILFVDTGDWFNKGDLTPLNTQGEAIVEMMGACKYDAVITGNHEYTFGTERLVELVDKYSIPLLAANWTGPNNFLPYSIHEYSGVKVGIIGTASTIRNRVKDKDMKLQPVEQSVKAAVEKLESEVDIIVLLTHLGARKDRKLITAIPRLDILFGGHNHKRFSTLEFNEETRTVLQHSGGYGKCLGELTVTWDGGEIIDRKLRLIKVSEEMAPSKQVKAIAEKYLTKQQNIAKQ
jgi:2',3'-cyclic-nucleotide 2'-phosphodiesterase (5'-nucleotidase family)